MKKMFLLLGLGFNVLLGTSFVEEKVINAGSGQYVSDVCISPDGKTIVAYVFRDINRYEVLAYDRVTGEIKFRLPCCQNDRITYMTITPQSDFILIGRNNKDCVRDAQSGVWGFLPGTLEVRDCDTGNLIRTFNHHLPDITTLCTTSNGECRLVMALDDRANGLSILDLNTGKTIREVPFCYKRNNKIKKIVCSQNGSLAAVEFFELYGLKVIYLDIGKLAADYSPCFTCFTLIANGNKLFTAGSSTLRGLFCKDRWVEFRHWDAHDYAISCMSATQDSNRLITGSNDRVVKVWDISSNGVSPLCLFKGHADLHETPERKEMYEQSNRGVVWAVEIPESDLIASACNSLYAQDLNIKIWNWKTGEEVQEIEARWSSLPSFTSDGKTMVLKNGLDIKIMRRVQA